MKEEEIEKQAEAYTEENGEKYNAHLSSKRKVENHQPTLF